MCVKIIINLMTDLQRKRTTMNRSLAVASSVHTESQTETRTDVCLTFDSSTIHAKNLKNQQGCNGMTINLM